MRDSVNENWTNEFLNQDNESTTYLWYSLWLMKTLLYFRAYVNNHISLLAISIFFQRSDRCKNNGDFYYVTNLQNCSERWYYPIRLYIII